MIDHCVSVFSEEQEEDLWRNYMADGVKAIAGLKVRYYDLAHPVEDNRSANEIISSISAKLRRMNNESV